MTRISFVSSMKSMCIFDFDMMLLMLFAAAGVSGGGFFLL